MGNKLSQESQHWATGEFEISEALHPHSLLYEHTKTIATLAVAFLGFSVGYVEKLLSIAKFPWGIWALGITWALLILSIVLVLLSSAGLHVYLFRPPDLSNAASVQKNKDIYKKKYNRVALQVGLAGAFLAAATIAFAVFGFGVMRHSGDESGASAATQKALAFIKTMSQVPESHPTIESLTWDEKSKNYRIVLSHAQSPGRSYVLVSKDTSDVVEYGQTK